MDELQLQIDKLNQLHDAKIRVLNLDNDTATIGCEAVGGSYIEFRISGVIEFVALGNFIYTIVEDVSLEAITKRNVDEMVNKLYDVDAQSLRMRRDLLADYWVSNASFFLSIAPVYGGCIYIVGKNVKLKSD